MLNKPVKDQPSSAKSTTRRQKAQHSPRRQHVSGRPAFGSPPGTERGHTACGCQGNGHTGLQSSTSPSGQCPSRGKGEQSGWSARGVLLGHEKEATAWTSLENTVSERRRHAVDRLRFHPLNRSRARKSRDSRGAGVRNWAWVWAFLRGDEKVLELNSGDGYTAL